MRRSSAVDWNTLRAAYEAGVPVVQICSEYNISKSTFYYWARKLDWGMRRNVTPENNVTYEKKKLLDRMFKVLVFRLSQIEKRISEHPDSDSSEASLDAKTLRSIMDMFDKLAKLEGELTDKLNKKDQSDENSPAEQLRDQLAERLAQLQSESD